MSQKITVVHRLSKSLNRWPKIKIFLCCLAQFYVWLPSCTYLIQEDLYPDPEIIKDVSGFYGVGSCLAWLLMTLTNKEFLMYPRYLARLWQGKPLIKIGDSDNWGIDATLFGSLAYSFVATVDLMYRCIRAGENELRRIEVDAQLSVVQLAWVLSLQAIYPFINPCSTRFYLWAPEPDRRSRLDSATGNTRGRKMRFRLWLFTFCAATVAIHMAMPLYPGMSLELTPLLFCATLYSLICLPWRSLILADYIPEASEHSHMYAWLAACPISAYLSFRLIMAVVHLMFDTEEEIVLWHVQTYVRFAFPRSNTKLSDLDQAAAFVVAVYTIAWQYYEEYKRAIWASIETPDSRAV